MESYKQAKQTENLEFELENVHELIDDLKRKLEKSLRVRNHLSDELKSTQEHVEIPETSFEGSLNDESKTTIT